MKFVKSSVNLYETQSKIQRILIKINSVMKFKKIMKFKKGLSNFQ